MKISPTTLYSELIGPLEIISMSKIRVDTFAETLQISIITNNNAINKVALFFSD